MREGGMVLELDGDESGLGWDGMEQNSGFLLLRY